LAQKQRQSPASRDAGLLLLRAIQLSRAAAAKVDLFVTDDNRFHALRVRGIQFIASINRVPL
jgi:hypothetical protein